MKNFISTIHTLHQYLFDFELVKSQSGSVAEAEKMNKTKMRYFEPEDILYLAISDEPENSSIELSSNVTAEYNDRGELIGIEILKASDFIRDSIAKFGLERDFSTEILRERVKNATNH